MDFVSQEYYFSISLQSGFSHASLAMSNFCLINAFNLAYLVLSFLLPLPLNIKDKISSVIRFVLAVVFVLGAFWAAVVIDSFTYFPTLVLCFYVVVLQICL